MAWRESVSLGGEDRHRGRGRCRASEGISDQRERGSGRKRRAPPAVVVVVSEHKLMHAMDHQSEVWHQLQHTAERYSGHAYEHIGRVVVSVTAW